MVEVWNITQVLAILLEVMFFLYFVWRFSGKIFNKYEPDVQELDAEIENVCTEITEIKAKHNVFRQEIFEYMDGILQPLNKRMTQRLRRQEKDLKEPDELDSRRGILGYRKK